jgi:hypothetical protein
MWGRTTYVVTVFDADTGKVYKHHHDERREAEDEVFRAKRWGFVAWATPAQKESLPDPDQPRHEATT